MGKWHKFFLTFLFGAFKRWNLPEVPQKSMKIKYFFNVSEQLAVPLVELARIVSCVGHPLFFCLQTRITCQKILQSHKLNLTYCLKSSLLLAFWFLFVCMVDQTQMYPSFISPLELFQGIICNIHSVKPLIYRGLAFLKNHSRGDQDFLLKMGGGGRVGVAHVGEVVYRKGGKHCFSLEIYGFCGSNALYSAGLSFWMFIIILD